MIKTKANQAARSVWLGGPSKDTIPILLARVNNPEATFPDIEAFMSAYESNLEAAIRKDPDIGEVPVPDEKLYERIVQLAENINEEWPLPVPLKIHIKVTVAHNTYSRDGIQVQLNVAPQSWRTLRLYNQLKDLRVQEVISQWAPVVILEEAGRFRVVVPPPVGWDDDPFALESES